MRRRLAGFRAGRPAQAVISAAAVLVMLAVLSRSVWLQVLACGLFGLVAASALSVVLDNGCEVTLRHPNELAVGTPVDVCFTVENPGLRRSRPLLLHYELVAERQLAPAVTVYVDPIPPGEKVEARATMSPSARGVSTGARWSVAQLGAFGLFSIAPVRTMDRRVLVAPAAARPAPLQIAGGSPDGGGVVRAGLDVRGVREWRPGDPARHVHWRASARTGELRVLERGEPSHGALGVFVVGRAGDPRFESVISVAAATVRLAIDEGADCYAWIEQSGAGCSGRLTPSSVMSPFAQVERAEPPSAKGFSHLLGHIGDGGRLLLALADDVPAAWVAQVRDFAASSGVDAIDLREFG